jgi:hypothetical protein
VTFVNQALTRLLDALMDPLDRLPVMAGLAVLSLVTAIGILLAFKWTADQRALLRSKRAMQAGVFEMRLFNDDLVALFRAQGDVLRHMLGYLRHSFAPALWLLVPLLLLMIHMEFHFGYTGLAVGEPAIVKIGLTSDTSLPVVLEAPEGIRIETPAVRLPSERQIAWRIRPTARGSYQLLVHLPTGVAAKTLLVSDTVGRRSPMRPRAGFLTQLLNPSEPPVSGPGAIEIDYPKREVTIAGWNLGWSGVYLALTLAFALALKGVFRVTL